MVFNPQGSVRLDAPCGAQKKLRRAQICPYGKKTHLRFRGRGVYPTEGSCRFPLIVLQQTTQSFLATHNSVIPARPSIRQGKQQSVLLALRSEERRVGKECRSRW